MSGVAEKDKGVMSGLSKLRCTQKQASSKIMGSLRSLMREISEAMDRERDREGDREGEGGVEVPDGKDKSECITQQLKSYHAVISKYTKVLDKVGDAPLEVSSPVIPSSEDPYLELTGEHLCRVAQTGCVDALRSSGHYKVSKAEEQHMQSIHSILKSLGAGDLCAAEDWVATHAEALNKFNSACDGNGIGPDRLTFDLMVVRYLRLLAAGNQSTALDLAHALFPLYYSRDEQYSSELRQLMGCLLFSSPTPVVTSTEKDIASCPEVLPWSAFYPQLTLEWASSRASLHLIQASAQLYDLPSRSHLITLLSSGIEAAPSVKKGVSLRPISQGSQQHKWSDLDTMVLDYPADPDLIFHSVFSCPVSRETATSDNCPLLLLCGHVILKSSMRSLPKRGGRFKCPTCYHEMRSDDCMDLQF